MVSGSSSVRTGLRVRAWRPYCSDFVAQRPSRNATVAVAAMLDGHSARTQFTRAAGPFGQPCVIRVQVSGILEHAVGFGTPRAR